MRIVVIGGHGLIGSKLVGKLQAHGHEAVPADLHSGVNTITGEGLNEALAGAAVVIDVSNSPSFAPGAALEFFETSTRNLLDAERANGVGHHVALSVVGSERLTGSGYFRAKVVQETLISGAPIPYTIVRATQFFEFIDRIGQSATEGDTIRLAPVLIQPMAADDVASLVGGTAVSPPRQGTLEIAGPELFRLDELVRLSLAADDPRQVTADPGARYYGAEVGERTLVPDEGAALGPTRFADWRHQRG